MSSRKLETVSDRFLHAPWLVSIGQKKGRGQEEGGPGIIISKTLKRRGSTGPRGWGQEWTRHVMLGGGGKTLYSNQQIEHLEKGKQGEMVYKGVKIEK